MRQKGKHWGQAEVDEKEKEPAGSLWWAIITLGSYEFCHLHAVPTLPRANLLSNGRQSVHRPRDTVHATKTTVTVTYNLSPL